MLECAARRADTPKQCDLAQSQCSVRHFEVSQLAVVWSRAPKRLLRCYHRPLLLLDCEGSHIAGCFPVVRVAYLQLKSEDKWGEPPQSQSM